MNDRVRIFALGGLDERAKCLTVIEINDDIFVIECGLGYPDKTTPGVDYVIPRFDWLARNKTRVRAYILTHGHDVMTAGLTYVYRYVKAPVYCTRVTALALRLFAEHTDNDPDQFDFHYVEATSEIEIASRRVRFFQTAHNVAQSFGVAISTDGGNIVYADDFIIEHNAGSGYDIDVKALGRLAEEKTLILLLESLYSDKIGYTHPKNNLAPLIEPYFKEGGGRLFVALAASDMYNIEQVVRLGIRYGKRIMAFDERVEELFGKLSSIYPLLIPARNSLKKEDMNRCPAGDTLILVVGFGARLFSEIALFASGRNEDRRLKLGAGDTFIVGTTYSTETELIATDALDELYRSGAQVVSFKKDVFLRMHASSEDIKSLISLLRPAYYLPIRGSYLNMVNNAKLALQMNVGLNHTNVFILDNGLVLEISASGAKILSEKIGTGDLFIDGKGIGTGDAGTMEERRQMADEGALVIAALIKRSRRRLVGDPIVTSRGFTSLNDADELKKELLLTLKKVIESELARPTYSLAGVSYAAVENCARMLRRTTGKCPLIIPFIEEVP